ncbi:MAG: hypothetical protein ACR2OD_10985 [Gaiellaceae bacterium]
MPRVAVGLLLLLVVGGTAAAFAITETLKLEPSEVARPAFIGPDGETVPRDRVFSPVCGCPQATAVLGFTLRKADRVSASIIDGRSDIVRVLFENERLTRGPQQLTWDGVDDSGAIVPDGPYRLRLDLRRAGRAFLVPMVFRVDTRAPELRLIRAGPATITPDGDGAQDKVWVRYRSNEKAAPVLEVDGEAVSIGGVRNAGRSALSWLGRIDGEPAASGEYAITLTVRDRAGNVSDSIGPVVVTVEPALQGDG